MSDEVKLSRRGFVKGAGLAAGAAALLEGAAKESRAAPEAGARRGGRLAPRQRQGPRVRSSRGPRWPRCCATNST